jgi:hypothetical protein
MGKLVRLDRSGHRTIGWGDTTTEVDEVWSPERVEEEFDRIVEFSLAYVKKPDGTYESIRRFDPNAQEIFVTPALAGG